MGAAEVNLDLHTEYIWEAIQAGGADALNRAGAYMRGIARRKIKQVKNLKKHSAPGEPPRAHDGRYRNAILYEVDADALSVTVGPALYPGSKGNPGGRTVPQTLEYGGEVNPPPPAPWWKAHPALVGADAPAWLAYYQSRKPQGRDFGPAYAGPTADAALAARARAGKAMAKGARFISRGRAHELRAVDKQGRPVKMFFAYIKVGTLAQAKRVRDTALKFFGPPGDAREPRWMAARPLMRPTFEAARGQFPRIFGNMLRGRHGKIPNAARGAELFG